MGKNRKQGKKGKGCWWRCLIIVLMLLLAGGTAILINYLNSRNEVDLKFQELVNREFDNSRFADTVSKWAGDFVTKIRRATGKNEVCNDEGQINFDVLMSKDSKLTQTFELDKYDLAIYISQRNSYGLLSADNVDSVRSLMTVNDIEWEISEQKVEYKIVYKIEGSVLATRRSLSKAPKEVFLTAEVTLDLGLIDSVVAYNYSFNMLAGEDNDYCLNKIFGDSGEKGNLRKEFAYTPLAYIEELNSLWGTRLLLKANSISLLK